MSVEETDTVVVGGGQAGIAMSEHLSAHGIPHVVLERDRIAERWRTNRWDSLVTNGPAWHDRFPEMFFDGYDGGDFPPKDAVVDYLVAYAKKIDAPIREGVTVKRVTKDQSAVGFTVETSEGTWHARHIVAATGPFQVPNMPDLVPESAGITQLHSSDYRNPAQLPDGAVLVVGCGSSGAQIAEDLNEAGRRVFLSVGKHDRPPRRYRGRDFTWWLGVLGKWDAVTPSPDTLHVTIAVSGQKGGRTIDLRRFAAGGITLVGRTESYADGVIRIAGDLADNIRGGDEKMNALLDEADAYVTANGLDLPEDPGARARWPDPDCLTNPLGKIDLAAEGINTIIWATGYSRDFSWLQVDTLDDQGRPDHRRGIGRELGVYFLGLPWQSRRGSSFLWGVWHDAKFIGDQIAIKRNYYAHLETVPPCGLDANAPPHSDTTPQ